MAWALGFNNGRGGRNSGWRSALHPRALVDKHRGTVGSSDGGTSLTATTTGTTKAYARSYPDDDDATAPMSKVSRRGVWAGRRSGGRWISGKIFNAAGYAAGDWILAGVE